MSKLLQNLANNLKALFGDVNLTMQQQTLFHQGPNRLNEFRGRPVIQLGKSGSNGQRIYVTDILGAFGVDDHVGQLLYEHDEVRVTE